MRNKKIVFSLFLMMVIIYNFTIFAFAEETERGSIRIMLDDGESGTSKENVSFEYTKVADLIDGRYYLLDGYGEIDLNAIDCSEELELAAQTINKYADTDEKVMTDSEGEAVISSLETGVYLLRMSDKAGYENVSPVLIAIPTWDEEQKKMQYDVTVIPKHSPNESDYEEGVDTGDSNGVVVAAKMCFVALIVILITTIYKIYDKRSS